ncbi:MAG: 3-hydroxyacyl-CoA dehydrogenase NAD-binding domain-containing protein, partial [Myxococcota bacterium]|nr:3-hydroxyacyl-CoA dehydrogenase NAD-binding domain-containing protein [Myxococcota bacterium]
MQIRKAAVLGAGVMGSGIAAHLANAGVDVELLDLKPEWAAGALKKAQKQRPAPFMNKRFSGRVRTGGFDEHMDRIADCQWVIEVVTENLQIKHSLYEKVLPHLHSDAWLTSNTSGIPLASLVENFDAEVRARFFITHFFNPARYMRLLEVIPGPDTSQENITAFNLFAERRLGKGVVLAKDTVNFIANRIGVHGMMLTLHKTIEMGYSVREVDVITGPATGRPSSATFKTADLVGLDTLAHVAKNCLDNLPHDEDRDLFAVPDVVTKLIESGATGRKAGAGFYKKVGRDILTLDFATGEYISVDKPKFDSIKKARSKSSVAERIAHVLGADDRAGAFARATILRSLAYSANRLGEIADDVRSIDDAMRWGFNWDMGPFELWQSIGVSKVNELMESEGVPVPQAALEAAKTGHWYPENEELGKPSPLQRAAKLGNVVASSHTTRTLDIGDGVLAFEFFTKMNSLDNSVVENLEKAIDLAESSSEWNGLVIANDAERFSVGANIMLIAMGIQSKNWAQIEQMTKMFQDAFQRMQRCSI